MVFRARCRIVREISATRAPRVPGAVHCLRVDGDVLAVAYVIRKAGDSFLVIGVSVCIVIGKDKAHFMFRLREAVRDV